MGAGIPRPFYLMKRAVGLYLGRKEVIAASVSFPRGAPVLHEFAIETIGETPSKEAKTAKKESTPLSIEAYAVKQALSNCTLAAFRLSLRLIPFMS